MSIQRVSECTCILFNLVCALARLDLTRHVPRDHLVSLCWQMSARLINSNAVFCQVFPVLLEERAKNSHILNRHCLG